MYDTCIYDFFMLLWQLDREKQLLRNRYEIPSQPHMMVHPCTAAKGGKFNASVASLSLLLDYRVTDNKEHSFEVCTSR